MAAQTSAKSKFSAEAAGLRSEVTLPIKQQQQQQQQQQMYSEKSIRPMKLFTEWDVENAAPNCIPRSCCLRIVRLEVFRPLEQELKDIVICVGMQGSRRSLRSDQIPVQASGLIDVELDLLFTLQYPHFLKRRQNRLQVALQRRKKYKNRTILGYKTLAVGHVNMAQVLQGWYTQHLHLFTKDSRSPAAQLTVGTLSSQPIEHEISERPQNHGNSSDEDSDRDSFSSDVEDSGGELDAALRGRPLDDYAHRSHGRRKPVPRNLKQKIIQVLFKKLKVTEAELVDVEQELQAVDELMDPQEDNDEFMFDSDNDSDNEDMLSDSVSVGTVQKPGLRPFFDQLSRNESQSTLNQSTLTAVEAKELGAKAAVRLNKLDLSGEDSKESHDSDMEAVRESSSSLPNTPRESRNDPNEARDAQSKMPPVKGSARSVSFRERREKAPARRRSSLDVGVHVQDSFQQGFSDQLVAVLDGDEKLPSFIFLVNVSDEPGQVLALKLMSHLERMICTSTDAEIQATLSAVVNKLQKYCNRHSTSPPTIKVGLIGSEGYLRSVLRSYVDLFSHKPSDFQSYVRFFLIPLGAHKVASYIGSLDRKYAGFFLDPFWRTLCDEPTMADKDVVQIESRIMQYVRSAEIIQGIPIAEALITYKTQDGESGQLCIPFTTDVRVGVNQPDLETLDDLTQIVCAPFNSKDLPTASEKQISREPSFVSAGAGRDAGEKPVTLSSAVSPSETLDLQVDYWPVVGPTFPGKKDDKKEANKLSIKTAFRSFVVSRLPSTDYEDSNGLSFVAHTKARTKGVKRLMKTRDKDAEAKTSVSALVSKLVCTARSHGQTFNVSVDGMDWLDVKFFSLSYQWPTHIKLFPIAMFYGGVDSWS